MGYLHLLQQQTMPPGATEEMPAGERRRAGRWAVEWISDSAKSGRNDGILWDL